MKVLVFGASSNPERYSFIATNMLLEYSHEVVAVGGRKGMIADVEIQVGHPEIANIDTITLYMGPQRQEEHYDYLLGLSPKRIIFNPGTENIAFEKMCIEKGIYAQRACTLVLLRTDQFEEKISEY